MGNGYIKGNENIYFRARKKAAMYNEKLYSRAGAAELLGISVSTLADYELGITKIVPSDKIVLMADLYNCPEFKYRYCKCECPIGKTMPIATQLRSVEGAALRLVHEFETYRIRELVKGFVVIASDGVISDDEKEKLRKMLDEAYQLAETLSEVMLLGEKVLKGKM